MGYKTPKDALESVRTIGSARAKQPIDQILVLSFMSGCYIAFGAYCAILVGGNVPKLKAENPGVQKLLYGICFTVGLMMTALTGSDLYTGNVFTICSAVFTKKARPMNIVHAIKGIVVTFIGNCLGGLFVAYFFVYLLTTDLTEPWVHYLMTIAEKKVIKNPGILLLSGIGCNWIVSTAVFMNYTATDVSGKIIAMFLPIMAFAIYGFEHVVANAFFLPAAAMFGANVPVWRIIFWNYLPVAVGNFIGGVVAVGGVFWYGHMFRPKHHNAIENLVKAAIKKVRGEKASENKPVTDLELDMAKDMVLKDIDSLRGTTTTSNGSIVDSDNYCIDVNPLDIDKPTGDIPTSESTSYNARTSTKFISSESP